MTRSRYVTIAVGLSLGVLASRSFALPITFTDESVFLAATNATLLESFEDVPPRPPLPDPLIAPNLVATPSAEGFVEVLDAPEAGLMATDGLRYITLANEFVPVPQVDLVFSLSSSATAIGMTFVDFGDAGTLGSLLFSVSGQTYEVVPAVAQPDGEEVFFGYWDPDASFSEFTVTTESFSDRVAIDEIYAVPEPSTILLLGLGLVALSTRRMPTIVSDRAEDGRM